MDDKLREIVREELAAAEQRIGKRFAGRETVRVYAKIQIDVPARWDLPEYQREREACREIQERIAQLGNGVQVTSCVYPHNDRRKR